MGFSSEIFYSIISNSSILEILVLWLVTAVPLLIVIAYYTLSERKYMGSMQRRKGPNVVGLWGLLQPLADGFKLVIKEIIIPRKANIKFFLLAPVLTFFLSLLSWSVIPFGETSVLVDINYGVLFLLGVSGLGVYGIILAGWSSNSKYAFLGALRAAAQMVSYEVSLSLTLLPIIILTGSLNLQDIVQAQVEYGRSNLFLFAPLAIIFFISALAETNRAPFDLAEAEAEIVAGYNLEYSSIIFALFFLGEYGNMIMMSAVWVIFFFSGVSKLESSLIILYQHTEIPFAFKVIFICSLFITVRAALPRFRYDQLMYVGWKALLPLTLGLLIFYASILLTLDLLPEKHFAIFAY